MLEALAPLLFGLPVQMAGADALILTAGLSVLALLALLALRARGA